MYVSQLHTKLPQRVAEAQHALDDEASDQQDLGNPHLGTSSKPVGMHQ